MQIQKYRNALVRADLVRFIVAFCFVTVMPKSILPWGLHGDNWAIYRESTETMLIV
jgi:hypothetical protein